MSDIPAIRMEEAKERFDNLQEADSITLQSFITFCELMDQDMTKSDVEQWFQELDKDVSGTLSWEECQTMIGTNWKSKEQRREEMKAALLEIFGGDSEGDMPVPIEDLRQQLTEKGDNPISPEEADELLEVLDKDKSKTVDAKEVIAFLFADCGEDEQEGGEQ